jgi:hypothetical protein
MPNLAKCANCNQFDVPADKASDEVCSRCKPFQYEVGVKSELPDREMTATKKVTVGQQGEEEEAKTE